MGGKYFLPVVIKGNRKIACVKGIDVVPRPVIYRRIESKAKQLRRVSY